MSTKRFVPLLFVFIALGCGKKKDDDKASGGGEYKDGLKYAKVTLTASDLASTTKTLASDLKDCGFSLDIYRGEGACLTPITLKGYAGTIEAYSSAATEFDAKSARVAGVKDSEATAGEIIGGAEFDFAKRSSFTAYNELWNQYKYKSTFDYLSASLAYEKIQFTVKDKFVTMLVASYDQPFAESEIVKECVAEEYRSQARYKDADLLADMTFKRGDYLFCVKDTADAACAASDYKWLDMDSTQLVATRPSNPRMHDYLKKEKITCSGNGERIDFNIQGVRVGAKLAHKFKLYGDFSHGINSTQWPDARGPMGAEPNPDHLVGDDFEEPYLIYYYQKDGGEVEKGTNMDLVIDFDATEMLYIDELRTSDVSSASLETVLKNIYAKHDWVFQKKAEGNVEGFSVEQYYSMDVTPTITLSGGDSRPTIAE